MSETRTIRSLGVKDVGHAYFFEYEEGPPPENHFRLDTLYSGISAGTELTFLAAPIPTSTRAGIRILACFSPASRAPTIPCLFSATWKWAGSQRAALQQ